MGIHLYSESEKSSTDVVLLTPSVVEKKKWEHPQIVEGNDLSRSTKKEFHFVSPFCSWFSAFLWHPLFCPRVANMSPTRWFVHHGLWFCFFPHTHAHTHTESNAQRLVFFLESNKVKTGLTSTSKQPSVFGKCKVKSYSSVEFQMHATHPWSGAQCSSTLLLTSPKTPPPFSGV